MVRQLFWLAETIDQEVTKVDRERMENQRKQRVKTCAIQKRKMRIGIEPMKSLKNRKDVALHIFGKIGRVVNGIVGILCILLGIAPGLVIVVMFWFGVLLCLTMIFAIVGIALMIFAILLGFLIVFFFGVDISLICIAIRKPALEEGKRK